METKNCRDLLDSLSSYLDHELSDELCAAIDHHLAECENCRVVINTLRKTIELYHDTAPEIEAPEDVLQRLYLRLNLEEFLSKA